MLTCVWCLYCCITEGNTCYYYDTNMILRYCTVCVRNCSNVVVNGCIIGKQMYIWRLAKTYLKNNKPTKTKTKNDKWHRWPVINQMNHMTIIELQEDNTRQTCKRLVTAMTETRGTRSATCQNDTTACNTAADSKFRGWGGRSPPSAHSHN